MAERSTVKVANPCESLSRRHDVESQSCGCFNNRRQPWRCTRNDRRRSLAKTFLTSRRNEIPHTGSGLSCGGGTTRLPLLIASQEFIHFIPDGSPDRLSPQSPAVRAASSPRNREGPGASPGHHGPRSGAVAPTSSPQNREGYDAAPGHPARRFGVVVSRSLRQIRAAHGEKTVRPVTQFCAANSGSLRQIRDAPAFPGVARFRYSAAGCVECCFPRMSSSIACRCVRFDERRQQFYAMSLSY